MNNMFEIWTVCVLWYIIYSKPPPLLVEKTKMLFCIDYNCRSGAVFQSERTTTTRMLRFIYFVVIIIYRIIKIFFDIKTKTQCVICFATAKIECSTDPRVVESHLSRETQVRRGRTFIYFLSSSFSKSTRMFVVCSSKLLGRCRIFFLRPLQRIDDKKCFISSTETIASVFVSHTRNTVK